MEEKLIKLLLVEPDPDSAIFLKEALMEVEERQFGRPWSPLFQLVHVERLSDALEVLADERFDVALLDVVLPDSHSLHAYLRLRELAPEMSILMLADEDDEALAVSALREGAQDYLVKRELDCVPLARSLRHALERQRLAAAAKCDSVRDGETGLYNQGAFQRLARRDFELARRLGCDLDVVVVSLDGLDRIQVAYGRAERRLVVIEAAEIVRNICADVELAGRIDEERLAVAALSSAPASLRIVRQLRAAFRELAVKRGGRYRPEVIFGSASLRESGVQHWEDLLLAAESARTGAALTVVA